MGMPKVLLLRAVCSLILMIRALSIHDAYRAKDLAMISQNPEHQIHPNSRPWEDLPENVRDANRMVADHFELDRAIGCRWVPSMRCKKLIGAK